MRVKLSILARWLFVNAGPMLLLLGFSVVTAASFIISEVVGLYTLGGLLILLGVIALIPTERG